jgi:hypothetical protein
LSWARNIDYGTRSKKSEVIPGNVIRSNYVRS